MFTAKIENSSGEVLTLTQNEPSFQVLSINGLNPPPAQVNLTNIAGLDGSKFNSAKLNTRNIVIMLKLNSRVEATRQRLYRMFRTKEPCVFYYSNENRDVKIAGYVEAVECDLFTSSETMQISIICPQPYFKSVDEFSVNISNEVALFSFPFSINEGHPIPFSDFIADRMSDVVNDSDAETGAIITATIIKEYQLVDNTFRIVNVDTGETFQINYQFQLNDEIVINTNKGEKSVYLIRNSEKINLFSAIQSGSVFFQLMPGDNYFIFSFNEGVNDNCIRIFFNYSLNYRGV